MLKVVIGYVKRKIIRKVAQRVVFIATIDRNLLRLNLHCTYNIKHLAPCI